MLGGGGMQMNATTGVLDHLPSVIIMQFTGLLDENGREIYEGDIVNLLPRGYASIPAEVQITTRGVIFYRHDVQRGIYGANWCDYDTQGNNVIIIGNIYEHGHLLDKKDQK